MRIEFDPTNRDEATAVRAVLAVMYPEAPRYDPTAGRANLRFEDTIIQNGETPGNSITSDRIETSPIVPTPDLDANNEPHDPRIHSTPAKTNADGTWRAKRGVTAEQVAAVRAEREALVGVVEEADVTAETVEAMQNAAKAFEAPVEEQSAPPAPAPKPPGQSEAPLAPISETSAPSPTDAPVSFLEVMKAITAAQKDGHVTTAKVKELCAAIGAGDSTMGLNGADKGELRVQFMALLDGEVGQ